MFNHQETGEDTSDATAGADEALSLHQSHRDPGSQDRLKVSPATEEPQDDPAGLLMSEEVCELHTEVETLKQGDQGHVWRKTTWSTTTVERNYTPQSQKADEGTDEENTPSKVDIVAVTDTDPGETAEKSGDVSALEKLRKEERQELEDEELNNKEQMERREESGVKGTVLEEISAERPDTAEPPANTGGRLSTEGLGLEEGRGSDDDDEMREPPVVQRRGPRDRRQVRPKAKSTKQRQHKEEGPHTREAELEAARSPGRKEADKAAEDNQADEQKEKDQSVGRTREETSTTEVLAVVEDDRAEGSQEDVVTSTEGRAESDKAGTKETAPKMDPEKEESKDGERPRLQHASVILVDLKTNCNHPSVMSASGTSGVQQFASETEGAEPIAAERMDQKAEPASTGEGTEEQNDAEEVSGNEGKAESSHQNQEGEEAALIETVNYGKADAGVVPAETKEGEQAVTKDGVAGEDPADEEQSAEEASTQAEIKQDEAAVHLQPLTQGSEREISGEDEAEAEKQAPVPPEVDEGPVALAEDQESTAGAVPASNPEDTFGASEEKKHEEDMDPQGSDLQRVMVVLVDRRNSSRSQDETRVADSCVDEEQPAAEMEEQRMKEALKEDKKAEAAADGPGKASDGPEEAVTPQTPQSAEDDEAEGVSADVEVPVVERRIWRSGRKTGHARTPKGRSAAATPQRESEEQGAEEPRLGLEDVTQEELGKEGDDGVGAAEKEDVLQPHPEEDEEASRDEPSTISRALRKTKRPATATSRSKSKRSRRQRESEEEISAGDRDVEENKSEDGEIENGDECVHQEEEEPTAEHKEMEMANTEPLGDTEEEEQEEAVATRDPGSDGNSVKATPGTKALKQPMEEKEKETLLEASSGPGRADPEEVAVTKAEGQGHEAPEREEEELAEEETTSMEEGIQIDGAGEPAESENINDEIPVLDTGTDVDGTRIGMEEVTTETEEKSPTSAPEEDHQAEDDAGLSDVLGLGGHGPSGFTGAKELEGSDSDGKVESGLVTMETEKDEVINSELNADEDDKESNSEEEEELSGEDGEPVQIGKKVLRGRTVPAVVVTPQPKAGHRKRKRPETTPARKPRRRSRL